MCIFSTRSFILVTTCSTENSSCLWESVFLHSLNIYFTSLSSILIADSVRTALMISLIVLGKSFATLGRNMVSRFFNSLSLSSSTSRNLSNWFDSINFRRRPYSIVFVSMLLWKHGVEAKLESFDNYWLVILSQCWISWRIEYCANKFNKEFGYCFSRSKRLATDSKMSV